MRIVLARHFGMCFGVRDAIAQAEHLAKEGPLTILGELVHNPVVRERLHAVGARETADLSADDSRVMVTAHGASDRRHAQLKASRLTIADGTCPLVRRAHQQLKALVTAGYFPVVIGKRGHVEVRGLTEDFEDAYVLENIAEVEALPPRERYGVISQTTQPLDHVRCIVTEIRRRRPESEVRFVDTVCQPTKDRQHALTNLVETADTIVVVGGRGSNNTLQLVRTCAAAGRRVIHIERPEELRTQMFCDAQIVGVTVGTSTLPETVAAVIEQLEEISRVAPNETNNQQLTSCTHSIGSVISKRTATIAPNHRGIFLRLSRQKHA
jgi:4-hydroxy-3-methylbut-2-enyl diphosphate reductase